VSPSPTTARRVWRDSDQLDGALSLFAIPGGEKSTGAPFAKVAVRACNTRRELSANAYN
jgi:hypothetical protein